MAQLVEFCGVDAHERAVGAERDRREFAGVDPVADRLPRKSELRGKIVWKTSGSGEFDDLLPELRRDRPWDVFWPLVDPSPLSGKCPRNRASFSCTLVN